MGFFAAMFPIYIKDLASLEATMILSFQRAEHRKEGSFIPQGLYRSTP